MNGSLNNIRLEMLARDKQSSLLGPLVNNEILSIHNLDTYSEYFIFFITYEWVVNIRLEMLARDKQSSLLGPLKSYDEIEVLRIHTLGLPLLYFIFFITHVLAQ